MDWKKIGKKLIFPPVWVMILLSILGAAALVAVFVKGWEQTPVAYGVYGLAFYALSTVTVWCVLNLPKRLRQIKQRVYDNPLGDRYFHDRVFRTRVSLTVSLVINLAYVAIQGVQWYLMRSWWFVVLAGYYLILSVMRFLLVGYVRRNDLGSQVAAEWKRSRVCACILLLVNLSLSGAVLMILFQGKGKAYPGIMIYVMALYTFYALIHAAVQIVKYRHLGSPVLSTSKVISLSAALVSLLNLETAMFSQFGGDMAQEHQQIFIVLTGAGISIVVVTLSVLLIVKATKEIRREKHGA